MDPYERKAGESISDYVARMIGSLRINSVAEDRRQQDAAMAKIGDTVRVRVPSAPMRKITPRFAAGETVVFAVPFFAQDIQHRGMHVTIAEVGPFVANQKVRNMVVTRDCDYLAVVFKEDGSVRGCFCVQDWQLQKLNQPEDPFYLRRSADA
jgi:hypothetical protein